MGNQPTALAASGGSQGTLPTALAVTGGHPSALAVSGGSHRRLTDIWPSFEAYPTLWLPLEAAMAAD